MPATLTAPADEPDRYVVTSAPTFGRGDTYSSSELVKLGDVLQVQKGDEPDSDGDLLGTVYRNGQVVYVARENLTSEADLVAVERERMAADAETIELPDSLKDVQLSASIVSSILVEFGLEPIAVEALIALAEKRSAQ